MSAQIEEGEVPEEGEIMEEDEEDSYKSGTIKHSNVESTVNSVANLAVSTKSSASAIGISSKKSNSEAFYLFSAFNFSEQSWDLIIFRFHPYSCSKFVLQSRVSQCVFIICPSIARI